MKSALHWFGNIGAVGAPDPGVPTLESFELDGRYIYEEKQNLIHALEDWLWAEERRTKTCDNPNCPEYL